MKQSLFLLTITSLIFLIFKASGQNPSEIKDHNWQEPTDDDILILVEKFNLAEKEPIEFITLGECYFRYSTQDEEKKILISAKTQLSCYHYLKEENSWIVNYNNRWGLVKAGILMAYKGEKILPDFTPFDQPPTLLSPLIVKYPEKSLEMGSEGVVYVKLYIDKKGKVLEKNILRGNPEFNVAALNAIDQVKFKPAKLEGKTVDCWLTLPIRFQISVDI